MMDVLDEQDRKSESSDDTIYLQKNGEEALFTKVSFNSVLHCIPKSCVKHLRSKKAKHALSMD